MILNTASDWYEIRWPSRETRGNRERDEWHALPPLCLVTQQLPAVCSRHLANKMEPVGSSAHSFCCGIYEMGCTLIGCVEQASDGIKMMNEKDKKTYAVDANGKDVKAGQRVEVKGKTSKDTSGLKTLHVKALKDLGSCSPAHAQATQTQ